MTIVDEIRQLRAEQIALEARAQEIRALLAAAQAALEDDPPTRPPPTRARTLADLVGTASADPAAPDALVEGSTPFTPLGLLTVLEAGPRRTGDLAVLTGASLEATRQALKALEAQGLVIALGRGNMLRWHITDAGSAHVQAGTDPPPPAPAPPPALRTVAAIDVTPAPTTHAHDRSPSAPTTRRCVGPGDDAALDPCPVHAAVPIGLAASRRCERCIREWRRRRAQPQPVEAAGGVWTGRESLIGDRPGYRSALADAR